MIDTDNQKEDILPQEVNKHNLLVTLSRVIVSLVLLCVALVVLLILLFPLKETKYKLVVFKSAVENFVSIRDIDIELTHDKVVRDFVLENYVIARETISDIDQDSRRRYDMVHAQSSDEVWTEFINYYNASEKLRDIDGFSRTVEVSSIVDLPNNVSIIEFALTDRYKRDKNPKTNRTTQFYKATIEYEFTELKTVFSETTLNPLSINVIGYELARIKK